MHIVSVAFSDSYLTLWSPLSEIQGHWYRKCRNSDKMCPQSE